MSFTCPRCGMTSGHPMDELEGYCGACHDWTAPRRYGPRYYGRDGQPMTMREYSERLGDLAYKHVAIAAVGEAEVSTVWLGLDHGMGLSGPPVIFETLVFGGPLDGHGERYCTLEEAEAGHERWVEQARAAMRARSR